MQERTRLDAAVGTYQRLEQELEDGLALAELADEEADEEVYGEAEAALAQTRRGAKRRELESLLSGEADGNDGFLEVHAGAGGTESQDWAEMLLRMYVRWAEQRGYGVEWIEESPGEEAGIKSAVIKVSGESAYGWLKTESGVHRLVRISPFDAGARRHTSFASVWVFPVVDETIDIEIVEKDLRSTPTGPRARAVSTSTGPTARSASPTCPPILSSSARPSARSTATRPRPCPCCAPASTSARCRSARARRRRSPSRRATSAGATRSAPTCCSPIAW
ncbi:Peptide chain release factor 2 [Geodia barretti]|uniref:Peptide chain release factor 2 n=1 Tax=Geodia barretti TaxID=519541 RepID=A0AA35QUN1_GEOBA|nr:Peptide chain release factor 2 [Geodia barretti]